MDNPLEAEGRSPLSTQLDDEAPRPLPPLPEEIIHHIIKLGYPPLSLTNGLQRRHFLHRILLINKSWQRLAKRELYRHLWLEKDEEVSELLDSQARDGQQLPTRSVTVAKGDLTVTMLRSLLGALSGLRSFCYISESLLGVSVDLELLAEFAPELEDIVLGTLRQLALRHIDAGAPYLPSLALNAPSLNTFMLSFAWKNVDVSKLEQGLQTFANHLKVLSIASETLFYCSPPFSPTFWSSFTTLETLIVDKDNYLFATLPHLVSSLQRLIVRPRPGQSLGFVRLLKSLESSAPCLASLEELHLPPVHPECAPERLDELKERHLRVTDWCAERGIQVVTTPFIPEHDFLGYLEEVLDLW